MNSREDPESLFFTEAFMQRAFADGYVMETGTGIAKILPPVLKDMYASEDKTQFADSILTDIIEQQVSKRKPIHLPSDDIILAGLREILENIADCENAS